MKMCDEHVLKGKSISHASEMYEGYDQGNLKYLINIYKRYGRDAFLNRENGVYKRDTKLLGVSRVEHGESIRSVALDLGLIEPSILGDWVRLYKRKGEAAIQDTYPRKGYTKKKSKRWRKYNSYEGDLGFTKPNHMNQDFQTTEPFQKAGADVTMLRTNRGTSISFTSH